MVGLRQRWRMFVLGRFCVGLMVVSLALRVFIPDGFMLSTSRGDDGTALLVICTASGFKVIDVGEDGGSVPSPETEHAGDPCCTLCSGPTATADAAGGFVTPIVFEAPVRWPVLTSLRPAVRAGPKHSIRGPPSIA